MQKDESSDLCVFNSKSTQVSTEFLYEKQQQPHILNWAYYFILEILSAHIIHCVIVVSCVQ